MKRRFSGSQRIELYLDADGICQLCGTKLQKAWHADHVVPYSAGGPTITPNGQALCPTCNLKKGTNQMHQTELEVTSCFPDSQRTRLQIGAVKAFLDLDKPSFLLDYCPAGGKTYTALLAAQMLFKAGLIDRVIIVCPTDVVKAQWANQAWEYCELNLARSFKNDQTLLPDDVQGVVVSYQAVASQPYLWQQLAKEKRTLLICDEIHHCGTTKSWGAALYTAFDQTTVRRFLTSGTPFRSDGDQIPWIEYDEHGYSIADDSLSYKNAVSLGICRAARFDWIDTDCNWLENGQAHTVRSSELLEDDNRSQGLDAAYSYDEGQNDCAIKAIKSTYANLKHIRDNEYSEAGMLIVAKDIPHAEGYEKLCKNLGITNVVLVHSKLDGQSNSQTLKDIKRFKDNPKLEVIIAVNMVSEGVDIPRLVSAVFFINKSTELYMRQLVGRVTRTTAGYKGHAFITMVKENKFQVLAQRIEEEAVAGLRDQPEPAAQTDADAEGERDQVNRAITIVGSSNAAAAGYTLGGGEVTAEEHHTEAEFLKWSASQGMPLPTNTPRATLWVMMNKMVWECPPMQQATQLPDRSQNPEDRRDQLRNNLTARVNAYVRNNFGGSDQMNLHYALIWKAIKHNDEKLTTYTIVELERCHRMLDSYQEFA
jgi:superfamily II DNA or RNA helicase